MRTTRRLTAAAVSLLSATAALAVTNASAEAADEPIPAACGFGTVHSTPLLSDDFNPDTAQGTTWDFSPSYSSLSEPKFAVVQREGADGDTWRLHVDQPTQVGRVAAQGAVPVKLPAGRQVQLELRHEGEFEHSGGTDGVPFVTSTEAHVETVREGSNWGDSIGRFRGDSNGARPFVRDISDQAGATISPRFVVYVSAEVPTAPGWDIDNVAIYTCDQATPSAPHTLVALGGVGRAELSWHPPTWSGSSRITGYRVTVSPGDQTYDVAADQTSLVVPNLQSGTDYDFVLRAVNAAGAGRMATKNLEGTKLSISPVSQSITYNNSATLTDKLTDTSGNEWSGEIRLQARRKGTTAWATVQTRPEGRTDPFETWGPSTNYEYRVRFAGDRQRLGSVSPIATVLVRPKVRGMWVDDTVRSGQIARFGGSVDPGRSGDTIYLQRLIGGTWRNVQSTRLDWAGKYVFHRETYTRGTFQYRSYRPSAGGRSAGYSVIRKLYVS